jgi:hypothetical protein
MANDPGLMPDTDTDAKSEFEGNARYLELAKANGLLDKSTEVAPAQGEKAEEATPEPEQAGDQNTTAPQVEQSSDKDDWRAQADEGKWPKGFRKQLSRMERQAERKEREFTERIQEFERKLESLVPVQKPQQLRREQFATESEYISAMVRVEAQQLLAQERAEQAKNGSAEAERQQAVNTWFAKIEAHYPTEEAKSAYQEALEELGNPYEALGPEMSSYVEKSAYGPKMLEYLANRQGELRQIRQLHPADQIKALQAIASFVSRPKTEAPKVSKAPSPVGKLGSAGSGVKSVDEMSQADKLAYYRTHHRMPGE